MITKNVTLKLPDDICRQARHRAVDEHKSLSARLAALLERELNMRDASSEKPKTLIEALTLPEMPDWFHEKKLALEDRRTIPVREFSFDPKEN